MRRWIPLIVASVAATVAIWGIRPSAADPGVLEPSPTPPAATWTPGPPVSKSTPTPAPPPPSGPGETWGSIVLYARFSGTWPWMRVHWQEPWTVVQWQDRQGDWHDVEGWRGALDAVETGEGGTVVGEKVWWVAPRDFGTGPFRWVITLGEGGRHLGVSEPFDLPAGAGAMVLVEVVLE